MGIFDGLWHVLNFFSPALGLGCMAACLAKLFWWRELVEVGWLRLAAWGVLGSVLALTGGLMVTGVDGKIFTYCAMVVCCALALWWAGWGRSFFKS